jgi:glutaminyl-tRNA synthetase
MLIQTDPDEGKDWLDNLNPNSLTVLSNCKLEPYLKEVGPGFKCQFERLGYFCADIKESTPGKPVFNRTVTLRDNWAKNKQVTKMFI